MKRIFYLIRENLKSKLFLIISLIFLAIFFFSLGILATRDMENRDLMIKSFPLVRSIRSLSNLIYLPYYLLSSDLPVYYLEIDPDDLKKLNENLPEAYADEEHLTEEYKDYVPAKFFFDDKEYKVEVRYRGDTSAHWSADKKSWLIKFDKDNLFKGMKKIHLILPFDRGYLIEHFNNYRAQKLGLMVPESGFSILRVNGKNNGTYFMIEGWDKELVSKENTPDETNLYELAENTWMFNRIVDRFGELGFWLKEIENQNEKIDNYAEFNLLLDLINNASDEEFFEKIPAILDMDNFYRWQIHSLLVNSKHQMVHDLRFYFNNASGKFELIPWDVNQEFLTLCIDENYNPLIGRIFKNPEFVHQRNKILWEYVQDGQNLEEDLAFYDKIYEDVKIAYYKDPLKVKSNLQFDLEVKDRRQRYIENYRYIKNAFEDAQIFTYIYLDKNGSAILDLATANFGAINFNDLTIETENKMENLSFDLYFDQNKNGLLDFSDKKISKINYDKDEKEYISDSFNLTMHAQREVQDDQLPINLEYQHYRFFVKPSLGNVSIDKVKFGLINYFNGKKVKPIIRYIDNLTFTYFNRINQGISEFQRLYPYFVQDKINPNQMNLLQGNYFINETVIIPENLALKIYPGANLYFAPETSLVSYGNVLAEGTASQPIKLSGQNKNNWGVFAVVGPTQGKNIFKNCIVENGGEAYINSIYFTGQLAVHYADVEIENCRFLSAQGDDGLNVKKGKIEIRNNYFSLNKYDALDLDWTSGVLEKNYFVNNGQNSDQNGDGIDISGTKDLLIVDNVVEKSPDKCLSIGEKTDKSTIIFNNLFSGCQMGIAVKDSSEVQIVNNVIVNNKIGIAVYEKKPVFGGAFPSVFNTIIWSNNESINIDEKSEIAISYSNIEKGYKGENNLEQLPTFGSNNYFLVDNDDNSALIKGGNVEIVNEVTGEKFNKAPIGLIKN